MYYVHIPMQCTRQLATYVLAAVAPRIMTAFCCMSINDYMIQWRARAHMQQNAAGAHAGNETVGPSAPERVGLEP